MAKPFDGMDDSESIDYQLKQWVAGKPLHNTVRDECCPDFSCCNGGEMMPPKLRQRFADAYKTGDEGAQWKILIAGLEMLTAGNNCFVGIAVPNKYGHRQQPERRDNV